jgi:hypothetical protein
LVAKGAEVSDADRRWIPADIQASGFALKDSAAVVQGFVVAAARLPDCTGTLVKTGSGGPSRVEGTKHCKPWSAFPEYEARFVN